jgi:hypothetical protein
MSGLSLAASSDQVGQDSAPIPNSPPIRSLRNYGSASWRLMDSTLSRVCFCPYHQDILEVKIMNPSLHTSSVEPRVSVPTCDGLARVHVPFRHDTPSIGVRDTESGDHESFQRQLDKRFWDQEYVKPQA